MRDRVADARSLAGFLAQRLASLLIVATLAFACVQALPGDPARLVLGPQASAESIQTFRRQMELDLPVLERYRRFLVRAVRLDFGQSLAYRRPVRAILRERLPYTASLAAGGMVVVVVVALSGPFLLAGLGWQRARKWLLGLTSTLGVVPPYALAVMLLGLLGARLRVVPVLFVPDSPRAWILPICVVALPPAMLVMRVVESQLAVAEQSPYVMRAYAYGFGRGMVILREVVPTVLPSLAGALSNAVAYLVTGTLFAESVFGLPGIGRLAMESARSRDVVVLQAICVVFGACVVLGNGALQLAARGRWFKAS